MGPEPQLGQAVMPQLVRLVKDNASLLSETGRCQRVLSLLSVKAVLRREGEKLHQARRLPEAPGTLRSPTETRKPPSSQTRTTSSSPRTESYLRQSQ
jgi:hypothetical protein